MGSVLAPGRWVLDLVSVPLGVVSGRARRAVLSSVSGVDSAKAHGTGTGTGQAVYIGCFIFNLIMILIACSTISSREGDVPRRFPVPTSPAKKREPTKSQ